MYLLHTQLCAWACYKTPCPHRHNVRSTLVLGDIADSASVSSGPSNEGPNRRECSDTRANKECSEDNF